MYKNIFKYDDMKRAEHMAVRQTVGWYTFTHYLLQVSGPDARKFMDYIYPNNIQTLKVGKDRYTTMLNDEGNIIDDVVIMCRGEEEFLISTLYASKADDWIYFHSEGYDIDWEDVTDQWHMFSIQGPKSKEMLSTIVDESIEDLKFFNNMDNTINGKPCLINRTGFTGEKFGYELYVDPEDALEVEEMLKEAAPKFGGRQVTDFQVLAWTLPTEAGFYYMRDLSYTNPFEVGLADNINWEKDFIGKEALLKVKENGPEREMVGFIVPEDDIYIQSRQYGGPGQAVYIDGEEEEVGRVYKMVYSYVNEVNNGYIMAKKGALKIGDHIKIHGHEAIITERNWLKKPE